MADRIVVLGTGGTIAGAAASPGDHLGYKAGALGVQELLDRLPATAGLQVTAEQVAQIDSKDMGFAVWQALAARCAHWLAEPGVQGIVVTHGTDTLEETAYFLQRVLAPARPVVLTCAMRPATAIGADGPQNLLDAIAVVRSGQVNGVSAVCAGTLHTAQDVHKVHPYRLDAFSSGDAGPLGFVEDGQVRLVRAVPQEPVQPGAAARVARAQSWPRVEIVTSHAGAGARVVELLVADGVQGVVAAGTGNGALHEALEQALLAAQAAGVRVLRTTRWLDGRLVAHGAGRLATHPLTPVKARVDLLLELLPA